METTKDRLAIQTPEQVGFEYVLAGLGSRTVAFMVDTAIRWSFVLGILVVVGLFLKFLPALGLSAWITNLSKNWAIALGVLAYGCVELGYFLLFEALWSGQTPGKRRQGLRVIRINGQPIGWLESAIRNILRAVDLLAGVYPVGIVVVFLSRNNQRIGDYAAGTVVIVERKKSVPGGRKESSASQGLTHPEVEWYVSRLKPAQYQVLRSFLERREQMEQAHRHDLARLLSHQLFKQMSKSTRMSISYESFIEEIVALYEKRRRAI
ncbi:MAG: RDD family protein [Deltaproteobacteria bacterium]|nr:RDD family protein [Deltaproteobacteria bacterium]NTV55795.1 RDD family protein [Deltaproteobacteria bacterium]